MVLRFGECFGDFEVSHGCLRHCVDDILLLKGGEEGVSIEKGKVHV